MNVNSAPLMVTFLSASFTLVSRCNRNLFRTKAITKPFGKWPRSARRTRDKTRAIHPTVITAAGTRQPKWTLPQLLPLWRYIYAFSFCSTKRIDESIMWSLESGGSVPAPRQVRSSRDFGGLCYAQQQQQTSTRYESIEEPTALQRTQRRPQVSNIWIFPTDLVCDELIFRLDRARSARESAARRGSHESLDSVHTEVSDEVSST